MRSFPTDFTAKTLPLPSDLPLVALSDLRQLHKKGYVVTHGLTKELALEISEMAKQPSIAEYCPKDASPSRFESVATTAEWLKKGSSPLHRGRAVFLLHKLGEDGSLRLAGYGWAGPERSPLIHDGRTTMAVRIGEADQGKGLARPFTEVIVLSSQFMHGARGIWLETWASNHAATVYQKVGFQKLDVQEQDLAMRPSLKGFDVPDERIYMAYPDHEHATYQHRVRIAV